MSPSYKDIFIVKVHCSDECCWCKARLNAFAWNHHMWLTGFSHGHNSWIRHKEAKQLLIFHSCCPTCPFHLSVLCFFFSFLFFSSTAWVRAGMNLNKNTVTVWSLRTDIIMTSPSKVKLSHRHDKVHSQRGRNRGVKGERCVEITNWCRQMVLRGSRVVSTPQDCDRN